jgi:hypothetical protein
MDLKRYRVLTPTIRATQWFPGTETDGVVIEVENQIDGRYGYVRTPHFAWGSGAGLLGNPGDYLVKRGDNKFYFQPREMFEARFELSDDQS